MDYFFEDMGRVICDVVEDLGKKTSETVEIQRLKSKCYAIKKDIGRGFHSLGRQVYCRYEANEDIDPEYAALCEQVRILQERLEELEEQIGDIRGLNHCKKCKASMDRLDSFCKRCGTPAKG
jgi:hypothetical protein